MDRIVYLGPYNNKNEKFFQQSLDYLKQNKGDRFYYILPNGKLLNQYRKAMIKEIGGTFNINLFTFDNIVDKLLEGSSYAHIDENMKEALLKYILSQLINRGQIKYYKNISTKEGFIKILSNIIGEIKRSLIDPETYLSKCIAHPFYKEIGIIYREYENWLNEEGFLDREGSFFKSLEILKKDNSFFNNLDYIFIEDFFDFRPQELKLLEEITKTEVPIYINMSFNRDENFSTLNNTLTQLKELGFQIEYVENESRNYYEIMANEIFSDSNTKLESNTNIKLIKANNNYLEMKKICERIKYHYSEGIELEDMALILTNPEEYKEIMFQVFQEEKIPCTLDKDINLIEIPWIKELIYILELKVNHGNKQSIINRVKSSYFKLCNSSERDALEYILRKTYFIDLEDIKNSEELLASDYGEIIDKIIMEIDEEINLIPEKANIEEYIILIENILSKFSIQEQILNIYKITLDYNLLHRDLMAMKKFNAIVHELGKLNKIFIDKISLEDFLNILESYIENESITEIQGNNKGINILTPTTARGQEYDILFVAGLSQGKYPSILDENFFFKEKNSKELKNIGIDFKNYYERLDKEFLVFSTIISTCGDKLYLSYSENSTGDEKDIASMFLDEILERIEGEKIEDKLEFINVDIDYLIKDNPKELTTKDELFKHLLQNPDEGEFAEESAIENINCRLLCEIERSKEDFNEYNGKIEDPYVIKDMENFHRNKVYSISYLESYGICPYAFLLSNILNIEEMEREIIDFSPLDRGTIIHEVLREYYYNYKNEIEDHVLGKGVFSIEDTYDYIVDRIEFNMKSMGLETETKLWKLRIESNANNILNLIRADLDRMSKYKEKVLPLHFEIDFGRSRPFFIEIDGHKIPLRGKIDRIDKYVDSDKYIIIDYKNTGYGIKEIEDMESGLSLQLPVYIMSQEDKNIVAAMYAIVSNGKFDLKIINAEEKQLVGRKRKGVLSKEELEELLDLTKSSIKAYINAISSGDFSINPKECSPYCIYKDICRYKKKLEVLI